MHNVELQTDNLIEEIRKSKEFGQYQRLLDDIRRDAVLYERLNEYRRSRFSMHMTEGKASLEESDRIAAEYEDLLRNELAVEFLEAEQRYCKMIKRVNDRVLECMDMDLDFLEG